MPPAGLASNSGETRPDDGSLLGENKLDAEVANPVKEDGRLLYGNGGGQPVADGADDACVAGGGRGDDLVYLSLWLSTAVSRCVHRGSTVGVRHLRSRVLRGCERLLAANIHSWFHHSPCSVHRQASSMTR